MNLLCSRVRVLFRAGREDEARDEFRLILEAIEHLRDALTPLVDGVRMSPWLLDIDDALPALADTALLRALYRFRFTAAWSVTAASSFTRGQGMVALHLGDVDEAERLFREGLALCERERCHTEAGRCLAGLAEVEERRGNINEALSLLDRAATIFLRRGARLYLDRAIAKKVELQGVGASSVRRSIDAIVSSVQSAHPDLRAQAAADGTVTIMFGDIEDSTPVNVRLGDERYAELVRGYAAIVSSEVARHQGRIVKHIGDGFMAAFPRTADAVTSAQAIQRAVTQASFAEPIRVRIGLHAGSPVSDGGDFFGVDVTLASRIQDHAAGGEILVSSLLRSLVESNVDAAMFSEPREVELKGLAGTHTAYAVDWSVHAL